jgi:hypothetical protein
MRISEPIPTPNKPQPVLQWTTDDDEVAFDAVIVGIGSDGPALEDIGLTAEPVLASVYWPDKLYQGDMVEGRLEGPFEPEVALGYARVVAALYDFPRVAIQDRSLWRREWGQLREFEGLD